MQIFMVFGNLTKARKSYNIEFGVTLKRPESPVIMSTWTLRYRNLPWIPFSGRLGPTDPV